MTPEYDSETDLLCSGDVSVRTGLQSLSAHVSYSILQGHRCCVTSRMLSLALYNSTIILIANQVHAFVNMLRAFVSDLGSHEQRERPVHFHLQCLVFRSPQTRASSVDKICSCALYSSSTWVHRVWTNYSSLVGFKSRRCGIQADAKVCAPS